MHQGVFSAFPAKRLIKKTVRAVVPRGIAVNRLKMRQDGRVVKKRVADNAALEKEGYKLPKIEKTIFLTATGWK
jgi:hypothetical protein